LLKKVVRTTSKQLANFSTIVVLMSKIPKWDLKARPQKQDPRPIVALRASARTTTEPIPIFSTTSALRSPMQAGRLRSAGRDGCSLFVIRSRK
jgi:hypothetical protein